MQNNTNLEQHLSLTKGWKKASRFISFGALAAILSGCGKQESPQSQSTQESSPILHSSENIGQTLHNPFTAVSPADMQRYKTPWIPPMHSPGRFYPVLIPGEKGANGAKKEASMTTKPLNAKTELQNTWDPKTQTLTIHFPFSKRELGRNDGQDLQTLIRYYKQNGFEFRRIKIKGFADPVGGDINNDLISRQRVTVIQRELARLEVNEREVFIEYEAVGKREAKGPEGKRDPHERRVEITVTDAITESVAQLDPKPDVIFIDNSSSMLANLAVLGNYLKRGGNPNTAFYVFDLPKKAPTVLGHNADLFNRVDGGTPLFEAINGLKEYVVSNADSLKGRKPVIAVVTDGGANGYEGLSSANINKVIMHLVGVPGYRNCRPLEDAVRRTGGKITTVEK